MTVPTEYRLDHVAHRLIERLEATRRSWLADDDAAEASASRIADELVEAALAEYRAVAMADEPELHEGFLRREITENFLPRYFRLATEMNAVERRGYGFGPIATPVGRILIAAVSLVLLLMSVRFTGRAVLLTLPIVLTLPFIPDILGFLHYRSYRGHLEDLLDDMAKIQEQASVYIPSSRLKLAEDELSRPTTSKPEKETP